MAFYLQRGILLSKVVKPWSLTSHTAPILSLTSYNPWKTDPNSLIAPTFPVRWYAVRKGTRMKREKLKRAIKLKKAQEPASSVVVPKYKVAKKIPEGRQRINLLEHRNPLPPDDTWISVLHQLQRMTIAEAIQAHRETHHPDIYNQPTAFLQLTLECNMQLVKKNRFLKHFHGTFLFPHMFNVGKEKNILAFCKKAEDAKLALDAGALVAGGSSLIKEFQQGKMLIDDYTYIVAHPDIMPELVPLRGIMKKNYPTKAKESVDVNVAALVKKFMSAVDFRSNKDEFNHTFAWLDTPVGTLDMTTEQLEENVKLVIDNVSKVKHPTAPAMVDCAYFWSTPSPEQFVFDHKPFVPEIVLEDSDDEAQGFK